MQSFTTVIPTIEPDSFVAGDTIKWNRTDLLGVYPAGTWNITYKFGGPSIQTVTGTNNADLSFSMVIANSASAKWTPGKYWWQAKVNNPTTGETYTVGNGTVDVSVGIENVTAGQFDGRSDYKIILDNIRAFLKNDKTPQILRYELHGRMLMRHTLTELKEWEQYYSAKVREEKRLEDIQQGTATGARVLARFK